MAYSILIIDDSEEDRFLLKRYLKKSGLDANIAEVVNGERALEFLTTFDDNYAQQYPDLKAPLVAFLDVNMPIMNGWEFLDEIQHRLDQIQLRPVVVVMYSTSDMVEDQSRIDQYDFVKTYIVKGSCSPVEIKETVIACAEAE